MKDCVYQDDAPAVVFVDELITQAAAQNVSDIHLEPQQQGLRIRFRRHGDLCEHALIDADLASQISARIKIRAHLDITEKRLPHDGKFFVMTPSGEFDIRVATFPTLFGEKLVLRLLPRARHVVSLDECGFGSEMLCKLRTLLQQKSGLVIVTGPTGSGKTTTLYAALAELAHPTKNIVTLEDPIEYYVPQITQGQINPEIGFTFARGLRALVRQDPDIILVGEIRDKETAEVAINAALTGHLVLSTLHTNDAPGALIRLLDMGIEPFLINAALTGIVAQRLIKKLCPLCKVLVHDELLSSVCKKFSLHHTSNIYSAGECSACNNQGCDGRVAVGEFLEMTPALRMLVHQRGSTDELYAQAQRDGWRPLLHDILEKIKAGTVGISELPIF